MKVLLIHTRYKFAGGEDSVLKNEIDLLQSEGLETELLEFNNSGGTLLKILQLPFNIGSWITTRRHIRQFRPDVIHIHNLHFAGTAAVLYAIKSSRIPCVFTLHNYRLICPSATLFYKGNFLGESLENAFSWKAIRKGVYLDSPLLTLWFSLSSFLHQKTGIYNLPSSYIALGKYTQEIFSKSNLNDLVPRIRIKPNFCFPSPRPNKGVGKYYVYIGRLSEEKGVSVLLKSFAENGLMLRIAGNGPLKSEVESYAREFPNISFVGSITKGEMPELLENARALIFPSLWYETFGMVIIEAFASGVPVIASRLGQMTQTVTDGYDGLLFEAGNSDDLSLKLAYLEELPHSVIQLYHQHALLTYESFYTPEKNAALLIELYREAIVAYTRKSRSGSRDIVPETESQLQLLN